MADHTKFEALNVQVLAISGSNPFSQKTFADSLQAPHPFLSDYPDFNVIQQYDILQRVGDKKRPMAQGSFFLIDKKGIIRGIWMGQADVVLPNDVLLDVAKEMEDKS